jgi:hypothetical protein
MNSFIIEPPLLRWDGVRLVLNLPAAETMLRRWTRDSEHLDDVRLEGSADVVRVRATIRWKGMKSRVVVELREIRVRLRRAGFRIARIRVLSGVRVPRAVVEMAVERAAPDLVTVVRGHGIVVVDLRRWIPEEVVLRVLAVQVIGRSLHLWIGPGSFARLPKASKPALESGKDKVLESGA